MDRKLELKQWMEETVAKAKRCVERAYRERTVRKWLSASPPPSYEDESYAVSLYVYEGSPPKGYVIVDYGYHTVKAFGPGWRHLHTWQDGETEA